MTQELKCTKLVKRDDGTRDNQGRLRSWHEKCGAPACEVEVAGLLTKAKAVLCARHRELADRDAFISSRGYKLGQVDHEEAKGNRIDKQERLPGTGIVQS